MLAEDEQQQKEKDMIESRKAADEGSAKMSEEEVHLVDGPQEGSESRPIVGPPEFRMDQHDSSMADSEVLLEDRPSGSTEVRSPRVIDNRVRASARGWDDFAPMEQSAADKRLRLTTTERQLVDDRPAASRRERPTPTSSTNVSPDKKFIRTGDESDDSSMLELRIISSILRGVDITEVFSPARVVEACKKHGLLKGDSFDLRTGYDLSDPDIQKQVTNQIQRT